MKTLSHPILVLVRGLPGSGKSYIAGLLEKRLHEAYGNESTVMLDPDATDYTSDESPRLVAELTEQAVDPKFHPYRFLRGRAHNGIIQNKIIIWNQPFTNFDGFNKTVINLNNHAQEHNQQLPLLVVEVQTDPAVAKQRVESRKSKGGHGPSEETFARFTREYESFAKHGFTTVSVSGEADTDATVQTILESIQKLQ